MDDAEAWSPAARSEAVDEKVEDALLDGVFVRVVEGHCRDARGLVHDKKLRLGEDHVDGFALRALVEARRGPSNFDGCAGRNLACAVEPRIAVDEHFPAFNELARFAPRPAEVGLELTVERRSLGSGGKGRLHGLYAARRTHRRRVPRRRENLLRSRDPKPLEAFLSDTVLLVLDDSATMRLVYAHALSDRFTVRAVERVANARAVLPEGPDMILVDGGLEEADPYEIAANLKKPLKKAVAVILTSRFHPWDEKRAAKAGIEHHIDKPFETDAFRARLDVLMGREPLDPPSAAAMVLKANPKTRTPKPAPAAPAAPIVATKPVAVPVVAKKVETAAAIAPTMAVAAVKAPPKKEISYDLNFSGGWGEEESSATETAGEGGEDDAAFAGGWGDDTPAAEGEAAAEDDGFGGGWGDDTAAAEPEAAAEDDGFGGGWGEEEPVAEEGAEPAGEGAEGAEETPAEEESAEYTDGTEATEATAEGDAEAAPAEDAWGGEFDAEGFSAELTTEGEGSEEPEADAEATEAEAAPEDAEAAAEYTDGTEDGVEEVAAEGDAEAAPAQDAWGGEFDAEGFSAELTPEGEGDGEGSEEPEPETDAEAAPAQDAWGGEFDAEGFAAELTADDPEAEDAAAHGVPEAGASGSELRTLAEELDKLGLTATQAAAVLSLTREVVERAVWDVVPRLAEQIIREELDRLTRP